MDSDKQLRTVLTVCKVLIGLSFGLAVIGTGAAKFSSQQSIAADEQSLSAEASVPSVKTAAVQTDPQSIIVYVMPNSSKYHRASCPYLRQPRISLSLKEAKRNHKACSVCHPPK